MVSGCCRCEMDVGCDGFRQGIGKKDSLVELCWSFLLLLVFTLVVAFVPLGVVVWFED